MIRAMAVVVLGVGILSTPAAAYAQQPRPPRIGFLYMGSSQAGPALAFDAQGPSVVAASARAVDESRPF